MEANILSFVLKVHKKRDSEGIAISPEVPINHFEDEHDGLLEDELGLLLENELDLLLDDEDNDDPLPFRVNPDGISRTSARHASDFPCHVDCWDLLARRVTRISGTFLRRLWDICRSLPRVGFPKVFDWGHYYGGAYEVSDSIMPWETPLAMDLQLPGTFDFARSDPRASTETYAIFHRALSRVDLHTQTASRPAFAIMHTAKASGSDAQDEAALDPLTTTSERDCFVQILHPEICSTIAEFLSIKDVVNTRLASRAFWHVFQQQGFWATRFASWGERGWLSEVDEYIGTSAIDKPGSRFTDWRKLYEHTRASRLDPRFSNRARIWDHATNILNATSLTWGDGAAELSDCIPDDFTP